jgi:tRNA G18 (ribose-2'-O)-methylase SpoU
MHVVRIERFDDPRIDDYRNVSDAELLRRRGLFVAEGRLVVNRLFESAHRVESVLVNETSLRALERGPAAIPAETPVYVCGAGDFRSITGFNLHRGCLALATRPPPREPGDLADRSDFILVLEGVTDPDNVGSVFRNATAFGAGSVLLSPTTCDPLYRKAIRTSMGSVLRMPYARFEHWPADLGMLKAKGFTLVALTPKEPAIDLLSCGRRRRMAVLIGSEGPGLTSAAEAMADVRVRIPIRADVDSLNLATATGIALYSLTV